MAEATRRSSSLRGVSEKLRRLFRSVSSQDTTQSADTRAPATNVAPQRDVDSATENCGKASMDDDVVSTQSAAATGITEQPARHASEEEHTTDTVTTEPPFEESIASKNDIFLTQERQYPALLDADDNQEERASEANTNAIYLELASSSPTTAARSRAAYAKYGIHIKPNADADTIKLHTKLLRVEKPIRVRLHWSCHNCAANFGSSRTCTACGHERCRKCPRLPSQKVREALKGTKTLREVEEKVKRAEPGQENVAVETGGTEGLT